MSWSWLPVLVTGLLLLAAELRLARRLQVPGSRRRLGGDLLAVLTLALLLVAPSPPETVDRPPLSIALAVDVSTSMAARDEPPNRLAKARQLIGSWLDALPGSSWSLVPFAGQAVLQVPLTGDTEALRFFAGQLEPGLVTAPGSAPEEALVRAAQSLQQASGERLILLLSDGERTLPEPPPPLPDGIPVLAVRLGSTRGAPVPDRQGQPRRDSDGALLRTRPDTERLQRLAAGSGGLLLDADQAAAVVATLQRLGLHPPAPSVPAAGRDWLPALALGLVLLRCRPRRPLGLRALGATALLLVVLACSQAPGDTPQALLEQAWQTERAGEREAAAELFSRLAEQLSGDRAAAAHYNAATLELAAGHPERALPRLEAALRERPGAADAVHNLILALRSPPLAGNNQTGTPGGNPRREAPAGRLDLQQTLLRSTSLQPAALAQPQRPQQERALERDW